MLKHLSIKPVRSFVRHKIMITIYNQIVNKGTVVEKVFELSKIRNN